MARKGGGKRRPFKEMAAEDLDLLDQLAMATRKKVADNLGITSGTLNGKIYRIKKRYLLYRGYVKHISDLIKKYEHIKRTFLSIRPPIEYLEDEEELDDLTS